jgi:hypothetical protein
MWEDYVGIVPGIAAAIMGIVTLASQKMRRWKKLVVIGLTAIAIGATGFTQWWTLHEKSVQETHRTEILEQLGTFIASGQALMAEISNKSDDPVPRERASDWAKKTEDFLQTLGNSYVVRFRSDAGLTSVLLGRGDVEHNNWWVGVRVRVIRLHEFSAEFSGQVPKTSSTSFFPL